MSQARNDPRRPNRTWSAIRAGGRIFFGTRMSFRVRGVDHIPHSGGALIVANHQSFLDPVLLGVGLPRPISFLARNTLFDIPVIGWVLRNTYVIPLDRESVSPSSIKQAVARMREGFLVGIFPEGTRTHDGTVGEFEPGFLTLVRRSKVPVIPVGIAGAFESYPRGARFPKACTIRMVVGRPMDAAAMNLLAERQNDEFVQRTREAVLDCFQKAERWRHGGPAPS